MLKITSFILIEVLIANVLGILLCMGSVEFLLHVARVYLQTQQKFSRLHDKFILKHYICSDIYQANYKVRSIIANSSSTELPISINKLVDRQAIVPQSSILIIFSHNTVIYYLRKSIVPNTLNQPVFALYRDDIIHNAQAIVENLSSFSVQLSGVQKISLGFNDNDHLEIQCLQNQPVAF